MKQQGIVILAFVAMAITVPVLAQGWRHQSAEAGKGRARGGAPDPVACAIGRWPDCDIQQAVARGLFETGLSPVFPAHAKCRGIDEGYWMDPVALFRKILPLDSNSMKALSEAEKQVLISVMFDNGQMFPANTKIVWPYTCTRG
ncbi:MAG: hypothetical protein HY525_13220 [Betaproteobacteria bacterium]|nr:hypothetical protein [Betaproteobacteria bacterium]